MTYDEIVTVALEMPGVVEAVSYGMPSLKRKGKFMIGLKPDGATCSVTLDWESHDRYLAEFPGQIYKTEHYRGWPAFLVNLENLTPELATVLIRASWQNAEKPSKRMRES